MPKCTKNGSNQQGDQRNPEPYGNDIIIDCIPTLLIPFLVGGEVTRGFAFAMLIGVITGTYSSIFVAAPILVDLGGKRALGKRQWKLLHRKNRAQTKVDIYF